MGMKPSFSISEILIRENWHILEIFLRIASVLYVIYLLINRYIALKYLLWLTSFQ